MKRAAAGLLLLASLGVAGCSARAVKPAEPASFVVGVGQQFDVRLGANPSTGYQWKLGEPLDEAVVKLVGSDYQRGAALPSPMPQASPGPGAAPSARLGESGVETWRFEAVAPGRTTIEMVYVRPFEKDAPPVKMAIYSVEVR